MAPSWVSTSISVIYKVKVDKRNKLLTYFNSVYIMTPSWVSTSMSMFLKSQKAFLLALEPLRQISADLSKAKDVLALIQEIVLA